jgi:hypothetical protein
MTNRNIVETLRKHCENITKPKITEASRLRFLKTSRRIFSYVNYCQSNRSLPASHPIRHSRTSGNLQSPSIRGLRGVPTVRHSRTSGNLQSPSIRGVRGVPTLCHSRTSGNPSKSNRSLPASHPTCHSCKSRDLKSPSIRGVRGVKPKMVNQWIQ